MSVRAIAPGDDLESLAALHAASFARPWTAQALRELLDGPNTAAFALPEGFIIVRAAGDESEVLTIAVAPAHRRRGIASKLLAHAAGWALERGAKRLFLEVGQNNAAALALYEAFGFCVVGRRPGYYGPGEDALTLRAILPFAPF